VTREATRVGLRVSSFQPAEERKQEYFTEKVFKLNFTGVYVQLMVFLERVSNLHQILRVDGFNIKPSGPQDIKYIEIAGTLDILAYRYSGTAADSIGTDPVPSQPASPQPASTGTGGGP
jgi:Tfp pilus assembly protein PilO